MPDRFPGVTTSLQSGSDIEMSFILALCASETFVGIVKLTALRLGHTQVVPDARIVGRQFCRALEILRSLFVILIFVMQKTEVVQVLSVVFVQAYSVLKRPLG